MTADSPRKRPPAKKAVAPRAAPKNTVAKTPAKKTVAKRPPAKKAAPAKQAEVPDSPQSVSRPVRLLMMINFKGIRDTLLFLSGLSGVFYETVFTKTDRPTLLLLFAAMMGLPAFLRTDENRK